VVVLLPPAQDRAPPLSRGCRRLGGATAAASGDGFSGLPVCEPKSGCNLIVMGTHGRRGVSRLTMGSEAELVVQTSPVPVLLVRQEKPTS